MELLKYSIGFSQRQFVHFKRLVFNKTNKNEILNPSLIYDAIYENLKKVSIDVYSEEGYIDNYKIIDGENFWEGKTWVGRSIIWTNALDQKIKISKLIKELNSISYVGDDIEFFMRMRMVMNCYEIIYGRSAIYVHGLYQEAFYKEQKFNFVVKVEHPTKESFDKSSVILLHCSIDANTPIELEYRSFKVLVLRRGVVRLNSIYENDIMPPHLLIASNKGLTEVIFEVENTLNCLKAGNLFELIAKLLVFTNDFKKRLPKTSSESPELYKLDVIFT